MLPLALDFWCCLPWSLGEIALADFVVALHDPFHILSWPVRLRLKPLSTAIAKLLLPYNAAAFFFLMFSVDWIVAGADVAADTACDMALDMQVDKESNALKPRETLSSK